MVNEDTNNDGFQSEVDEIFTHTMMCFKFKASLPTLIPEDVMKICKKKLQQ